jgi:hypothetical protein
MKGTDMVDVNFVKANVQPTPEMLAAVRNAEPGSEEFKTALVRLHAPVAQAQYPAFRFQEVRFEPGMGLWATFYLDDAGNEALIVENEPDERGATGRATYQRPSEVRRMFLAANGMNAENRHTTVHLGSVPLPGKQG